MLPILPGYCSRLDQRLPRAGKKPTQSQTNSPQRKPVKMEAVPAVGQREKAGRADQKESRRQAEETLLKSFPLQNHNLICIL